MKSTVTLILAALFLFSCGGSIEHTKTSKKVVPANASDSRWLFEKVSGKVLKFKGDKAFNTNLYELKYIGQVSNGEKAPFLIFSGRDCDECDANISIYIQSASDGPLKVENGGNRYGYPGTEKDFTNDSLLSQARAFYGQVLPGKNGVIWYQNQLMEKHSWKKSTFFVDLSNGQKKESSLDGNAQLDQTQELVKQGACKEIKGMSYTSEP